MVPDASDHVFGILHEHVGVYGIGTVPGIGQPEILPDHDPVPVAGLVKFIVPDLSYPVSDHGKIHVGMIRDSVVFPPCN